VKAITCHEFGSPDVLRYEEVETPAAGDDQVLIKVRVPLIAPLPGVTTLLLSRFVSQTFVMHLAAAQHDDLTAVAGLMTAGKVRPVIDRVYALSDVPQAIGYLGQGHARGKVVVDVLQGLRSE
jgi:NADPH:quinone reductase-like Zn-dependent oxidoreductase